MQRFLGVLLLLAATSTAVLAADPADAEVKNIIQRFQQELELHDVAAIGAFVSPDIVVLENGHRNNGGRTSVIIT